MFDRPTNVQQLLRNLKIAVDRDLLAQPEFATDENLLKFFNGSQVSRKVIANLPGAENFAREDIVVSVTNEYFPQMSVEIQRGLFKHGGYDGPSGHVPVTVKHYAYLRMDVAAIPDFTAGAVRAVFGKESGTVIGGDWASDGHSAPRTSKGALLYRYTDSATDDWLVRFAPNERKDARFVIGLAEPGSKAAARPFRERARAIYDDDLLAGIYIYIPEPSVLRERNQRSIDMATTPPPDPETIARVGALFSRPENATDLPHNLKLAYDTDLIHQPGFYEPGNLTKFFAGTAATWGERTTICADGSAFRDIVITADFAGACA